MLQRPQRFLIALVAATVLLTGCFTGERPTLTPRSPIDDPAADAVLSRLEGADAVDFIAHYDIIPTLSGATTTSATVAQLGARRRISIGDVVYSTDGNESRTCQNGVDECADFLDDARISDLGITHMFWGSAFGARLELDASRRIGPSSGASTTIAGQVAACVDVIVPSVAATAGTVVYCALDAGVLARYLGADVSIELTSFTFEVSPIDLGG